MSAPKGKGKVKVQLSLRPETKRELEAHVAKGAASLSEVVDQAVGYLHQKDKHIEITTLYNAASEDNRELKSDLATTTEEKARIKDELEAANTHIAELERRIANVEAAAEKTDDQFFELQRTVVNPVRQRIAERFSIGESVEDLAEAFGVTVTEVENSIRAWPQSPTMGEAWEEAGS